MQDVILNGNENLRHLTSNDVLIGRVDDIRPWSMENGSQGVNMFIKGGLKVACGDVKPEHLPLRGRFVGLKLQILKSGNYQLHSWRYMYVASDGSDPVKLTKSDQLQPADYGLDLDITVDEEPDGDW